VLVPPGPRILVKPLVLFAVILFSFEPALVAQAADCAPITRDANGNCPGDSSGVHGSVQFSIRTGSAPQTPTHGGYFRNPHATTMCPDGSYVSGACRMQPDGSYAGDPNFGDPN
jgi:hypothetical protein